MKGELPHHPHQCPCCELRFAWRTELEDHVVSEHEIMDTRAITEDRPGRAAR